MEKDFLINQLKNITRDISWELHVGYDPIVTFKRQVIDKINKISGEIDSGKLTKDEIKNKLVELEVLKQQYKTDNRRALTSTPNALQAANAEKNTMVLKSTEGFENASNNRLIKNLQPASSSYDWLSRPGYEPNDEAIQMRASASSFDTSQVGGPDYFKRAQFLCNQIRDAGLGDPKEFGCLSQDVVVSPEYSWKGNYTMVCSRLGTVWGGWYPEMFGCPKVENSIRQVPQKKLDQK